MTHSNTHAPWFPLTATSPKREPLWATRLHLLWTNNETNVTIVCCVDCFILLGGNRQQHIFFFYINLIFFLFFVFYFLRNVKQSEHVIVSTGSQEIIHCFPEYPSTLFYRSFIFTFTHRHCQHGCVFDKNSETCRIAQVEAADHFRVNVGACCSFTSVPPRHPLFDRVPEVFLDLTSSDVFFL